MAESYGKYSGIDALALRISRLDSDGNIIQPSATGAYLFCCEGKVSITAVIQTGTAIEKTGFCAGQSCNSWETPDRITGYTGELTLCNISDEVSELLGASEGLSASVANGGPAAAQLVGSLLYESGSCTSAADASGVVLETWSRPVLCKRQVTDADGVTLYRKRVIPWAYNFTITAAQATGDAFSDYVFSFKLKPPGANFASGPFNDNGMLNPLSNGLAPEQLWTAAEYWTASGPPTCAAGTANYLAVPSAPGS